MLLRHGQSEWNAAGRFTGWQDVALTARGRAEAVHAGERLAAAGLLPDEVHTSLLSRSIESAALTLAAADRSWIPVCRTWRLNERHYGALTGKYKEQVRAKAGEVQYRLWRNSLAMAPPAMDEAQAAAVRADPRYQRLVAEAVPATESMGDVVRRVLPWFYDLAVPSLLAGKTLLVVAHGNSLRALVCHLDRLSQTELDLCRLDVGRARVYEFDERMRVLCRGGKPIE